MKNMTAPKYSMAFTTGALFHHESVKLAERYATFKQWNEVRNAVIAENLLQARTVNTLRRVANEVIARLKTLSAQELGFLVEAGYTDQAYIFWLAVCRRYTFIGDFAVDVLHAKFATLNSSITYDDYAVFFNKKAEWHNELDRIAPVTKTKVRQTLFKMMREAGLLDKNDTILPVVPSATLSDLLADIQPRERMFFPLAALTRRPY